MTALIPWLWLSVALAPADLQALIDAGELDRAAQTLETVPEALRPGFAGQIALKRSQPELAAEAFERALAVGQEHPELHLYLAHAYLLLQRDEEALDQAQRASALSTVSVAQPLLEARARQALGDPEGAYEVLLRAAHNFPKEGRPLLELVVLAEKNALRLAARAHAQTLMAGDLDRTTALALFHPLYEDRAALPLLERLAARFPGDPELRGHLAYAYAASGSAFAAARLFEQATLAGGPYAFEAAEQYRRAERYDDALRMNARVDDPRRRLAQKIGVLFERQSYGRVVALADTSDDPAIRYRLAYAHYVLGNHGRATELARSLADTPLGEAGVSLLRAMGRSEEAP